MGKGESLEAGKSSPHAWGYAYLIGQKRRGDISPARGAARHYLCPADSSEERMTSFLEIQGIVSMTRLVPLFRYERRKAAIGPAVTEISSICDSTLSELPPERHNRLLLRKNTYGRHVPL